MLKIDLFFCALNDVLDTKKGRLRKGQPLDVDQTTVALNVSFQW